MVVSNVCYFHPYLGKIPILTSFPITFLKKKCNFAELRLFFFRKKGRKTWTHLLDGQAKHADENVGIKFPKIMFGKLRLCDVQNVPFFRVFLDVFFRRFFPCTRGKFTIFQTNNLGEYVCASPSLVRIGAWTHRRPLKKHKELKIRSQSFSGRLVCMYFMQARICWIFFWPKCAEAEPSAWQTMANFQ